MSNVLVIGDTHCPGMLSGYVEHLAQIKRKYKCDKVVHIGDLVDWHAISYHAKVQGTPKAEQEVKEAKEQIKKLVKAFPNVHWLLGNHDSLPARKAADADLPLSLLKSESVFWELPKTWKVYPRYHKLIIDKVIYSHGEVGSGGKHAAYLQARENFQSTVIGHLHGQSAVTWFANQNNLVFGMSVGCGIDREKMQFEYGAKFNSKPIISCGVVIDGKYPYLEPMLL